MGRYGEKVRVTVGERAIHLGFSSLAVLAIVAGELVETFLLLSDYGTSFGKMLADAMSREHLTVREMREYFEEVTRYRIRTILHRLEKQGLLARTGRGEHKPTKLGSFFLKRIREQTKKQKSWDGKWRIVAFDIPEAKREYRDWFRYELNRVGYRKLQQSVYVGRQPLPTALYSEFDQYRLTKYIRLLTVGEIDENIENLFK